jgi:AcrR family transcriptional regulator
VTSAPTALRRSSIGAQRNPESQQAILDAAAAILVEAGLAGFSIEAVARRARAGKPTIYRWWPSRAALLLDVYHHQKHVEPVPDTGTIEGDLHTFVKALLDYWRDSHAGSIFRFVIVEAQSDAITAAALQTYITERIDTTAELVRRAQRRGDVAADTDPELTIELLAGFAWSRLLTGRLGCDPQQLERLIHQVCVGLRA